MNKHDQDYYIRRILFSISRFCLFFLLVAFVVTCCMMLFLNSMADTMNIALTEDMIQEAAKITFLNVILLSLLYTIVDIIRRKLMVERPVKRIIKAAEKIIQGDYSVRIKPLGSIEAAEGFNIIIEYFNKMAQELSGTETLRSDFIANVSHELKTPLAVMQNYGTMLQQPNLSEEKRMEYSKAITDSSHRLADLITNILKLNKLENQQIHLMDQVFDLGEQLCECLLRFENSWEKKNIDIETDIQDEVMIKSDSELLSLVWNNLFSNAVKFTPDGGTISISLKIDGDFAVVKVADTGCGISCEAGEHMFEKFYQGDTSHSTQGNGLGLALVKRVIDIVGGDISVESKVDKGSVFTVKLLRNGI